MIGKNLGRPKKTIPESHENVILKKYERCRLNALYLEKVIYAEDRVRIPHKGAVNSPGVMPELQFLSCVQT